MNHPISTKKWTGRSLLSLLLIVALALSAAGWLEKSTSAIGIDSLSDSNQAYLDGALKKTLATFALLSALKVGLAIIEGTEIGVGFGIEIGDAVQSAYDFVDLAWRVVLTSAAILLGTRFLLQAAGLVDHWLFSLTLLLLLIWLWMVWLGNFLYKLRRIVQDVTLDTVVLTLTLYLVLPLSISGGRLLSSRITKPSIEEAEEGVTQFKADVFPNGDESQSGFWSKFGDPQARLKAIAKTISRKSTEFSLWILKIIAGYLFDSLIFPLLLFLIGVWMTKSAMQYFYNLNRDALLFHHGDRSESH